MPVSGKVYIVPNPQEKTWQLVVHNDGDQPFGLTQNILPPGNPDLKVHDDNGLNGHGLGVSPGQTSWQKFHLGDNYRNNAQMSHPISEQSHLRVGIRRHAFKTIQLPPLDGPPVELDIADFNWYAGTAQTAAPGLNNSPGRREHVSNAPDGNAILAQVRALMEQSQTNGIKCEGEAEVRAIRGGDGQLSHWEVWFHNTGEQAWIGTCTFKRGQKNEGIGLESMGMPGKDCSAMQRIEYLGNYGVEAQPGEVLRLGVRGYSWTEVKLPLEGTTKIGLDKFRLDTSKMADAYFDKDQVEAKRNEKRDRVQFFEKGEAINESLEPKMLYGDEAVAACDFLPPKLEVTPTDDGWVVSLSSQLPEFDDHGRVGFVAAVLAEGADLASDAARALGTKKLQYPGHQKTWHIQRGQDLGGVDAGPGTALKIATRGIGWFATVGLPEKGQTVDSTKDDRIWGLREDQIARRNLETKFINRFRE